MKNPAIYRLVTDIKITRDQAGNLLPKILEFQLTANNGGYEKLMVGDIHWDIFQVYKSVREKYDFASEVQILCYNGTGKPAGNIASISTDKTALSRILDDVSMFDILPSEVLCPTFFRSRGRKDAQYYLDQIGNPQDVVLKLGKETCGDGVIIIPNALINLEDFFHCEANQRHSSANVDFPELKVNRFRRTSEDYFIIQERVKSVPVNGRGEILEMGDISQDIYDPTMRIISIVEEHGTRVVVHPAAKYWKMPLMPIDGSMNPELSCISNTGVDLERRSEPLVAVQQDTFEQAFSNMKKQLESLLEEMISMKQRCRAI